MDTSARPGFTLIELLVVIAIIGVLSSVAVSAFSTARAKARDAAVQREMVELRTIFAREMSDTGSYAAIKAGGGWWSATSNCGSISGTYGAEARRICDALVDASGSGCGSYCVYFRTTNPNNTNLFSIMAYLPGLSSRIGSARYLCMGSSGSVSISDGTTWTERGCYQNP
ncbi:MAG TPA: prepilin-type N-terminal cleavage/methylation domain-containing protein [Candidatus Paceibacterota bacterium]|nr:prepilin-type N-terminal cleavage/methylation domain-containing protein [Candidatus Paceibacterota bacterium]